MKIIIPTDVKKQDAPVSASFGRAPWFAVFDTDVEEMQFFENSAAESQGGAGIKAAQTALDIDAKAVITPRLGQNAADVFVAANVTVYQAVEGSLQENIRSFSAGALKPLADFHPGRHGTENRMKIAVLSGKGGTGKTFVAVNLACSARETHYIDCDVEETERAFVFETPGYSRRGRLRYDAGI